MDGWGESGEANLSTTAAISKNLKKAACINAYKSVTIENL